MNDSNALHFGKRHFIIDWQRMRSQFGLAHFAMPKLIQRQFGSFVYLCGGVDEQHAIFAEANAVLIFPGI
jgi:hypothetical protein